jgi:hypothetical protein
MADDEQEKDRLEKLNAGIDQIWTVYQRFRSLGASESEAVRLAEALVKGVMSGMRPG